MKSYLWTIFSCMSFLTSMGQSQAIDSLARQAKKAKTDTGRINLRIQQMVLLGNLNLDSAIVLGNSIVGDSKAVNYKSGMLIALARIGSFYSFKGKFDSAYAALHSAEQLSTGSSEAYARGKVYAGFGIYYGIQSKYDSSEYYLLKTLSIAEQNHDSATIVTCWQNLAIGRYMQSDFQQALKYQQKSLNYAEAHRDRDDQALILLNMANAYTGAADTLRAKQTYYRVLDLADEKSQKRVGLYALKNLGTLLYQEKKFDSSYDFSIRSAALAAETGDPGMQASCLAQAAQCIAGKGNTEEAHRLAEQAIRIADSSGIAYNIYQAHAIKGIIYHQTADYRSAIRSFETGFARLEGTDIYDPNIAINYKILADCYENTEAFEKALTATNTYIKITDSVQKRDNVRKTTELTMEFEYAKKEQQKMISQARIDSRKQIEKIALVIGLGLTFLLALTAFIAFKNKQRTNSTLSRQKSELESTLHQLKATQAQLIQAEKMASLGELTAGIAHEIQNPLNFVNNFAELNNELIEEMKSEIIKGNQDDTALIIADIVQNQEKILHHGKRAESIVKGMLMHSRVSSDKREPTDLNALVEEYLRLAYHGMRAKDKSFNAGLISEFDPQIGKINLVTQDIGRVILNLLTNAFYSVDQKAKKGITPPYEPQVLVQTIREANKVILLIRDNGLGIPRQIMDKIFQPFFTTKPTGLGTGLGLSLSFDIIRKHGGELTASTAEGEWAEFRIELPLNSTPM